MNNIALASTLILFSAFLSALWNAGLKKAEHKLDTLAFMSGFGGMLFSPFLFFVPLPNTTLLCWIIASLILNQLYQLCLSKALNDGALTIVYPVTRGIVPLLVIMFDYAFLKDNLSGWQLICIISLALSILMTAHPGRKEQSHPAFREQALLYTFLTGIMIASYTIVDGLAVKLTESPFTYILWKIVLFAPIPLTVQTIRRGKHALFAIGKTWKTGVPLSILALSGNAIGLYAFSMGSLSIIAALRETSIVFAGILGYFWLRETMTVRKVITLCFIAVSALLLKAS